MGDFVKYVVGPAIALVLAAVLLALLCALPVMWLWNSCLVPAVTGVNEIGWLQAWGLTILSNLFLRMAWQKKE